MLNYKEINKIGFFIFLCFISLFGKTQNYIYFLEETVYSKSNPTYFIQNSLIVINGDSIVSDSMGRYIYPIIVKNYKTDNIKLRNIFKKTVDPNPKFIVIKTVSDSMIIKNNYRKYVYKNKLKNKIQVRYFDISIDQELPINYYFKFEEFYRWKE